MARSGVVQVSGQLVLEMLAQSNQVRGEVRRLLAAKLDLPAGIEVVGWWPDRARGDVVVLVHGEGVQYDGGLVQPVYQRSQFDGHVACVTVQQAPGV